jgi:hypothetical protein
MEGRECVVHMGGEKWKGVVLSGEAGRINGGKKGAGSEARTY